MAPPLRAGLAAAAALALSGCAAVGLTGGALTVAALQAGTGAALRAGTEYTLTGAAHRTFARPLDEVVAGVRTALQHMAMPVHRDGAADEGWELAATAHERVIEVTLTPLTPATTALKLVVKRGVFGRDRATASEIIAQTERALGPTEAALPRFCPPEGPLPPVERAVPRN
jgi:hypothetical protein